MYNSGGTIEIPHPNTYSSHFDKMMALNTDKGNEVRKYTYQQWTQNHMPPASAFLLNKELLSQVPKYRNKQDCQTQSTGRDSTSFKMPSGY